MESRDERLLSLRSWRCADWTHWTFIKVINVNTYSKKSRMGGLHCTHCMWLRLPKSFPKDLSVAFLCDLLCNWSSTGHVSKARQPSIGCGQIIEVILFVSNLRIHPRKHGNNSRSNRSTQMFKNIKHLVSDIDDFGDVHTQWECDRRRSQCGLGLIMWDNWCSQTAFSDCSWAKHWLEHFPKKNANLSEVIQMLRTKGHKQIRSN